MFIWHVRCVRDHWSICLCTRGAPQRHCENGDCVVYKSNYDCTSHHVNVHCRVQAHVISSRNMCTCTHIYALHIYYATNEACHFYFKHFVRQTHRTTAYCVASYGLHATLTIAAAVAAATYNATKLHFRSARLVHARVQYISTRNESAICLAFRVPRVQHIQTLLNRSIDFQTSVLHTHALNARRM